MTRLIQPVILCGGSGTRLWPLSRESYPKQFSKIFGDKSLFQRAVDRLSGPAFAPPLVLTNESFRFIVLEQLADIGVKKADILIEPEGRNTAPAILAAALFQQQKNPEALMLIAPSDHVIPDADAFRKAVLAGADQAAAGDMITFGIKPDRAATEYGWLELATKPKDMSPKPRPLVRFVEKPDLETAQKMLTAGKFLWNGGIFLFSVNAILDAFEDTAPDMLGPCRQSVEQAQADLGFHRLAAAPWSEIRAESIDYAVLEKVKNLSVVPFGGDWSDLGSWSAVWQNSQNDGKGVAVSQNATAIDCENALLRSESENQVLIGIGLKNIVAVAMPDAVLVADMTQVQNVKKAVSILKSKTKSQATQFPRDHRPWGWFETLSLGSRFQVKQIMVHPGAALSLQSHVHRAEHWVVVQGAALVTVGDEKKLIGENQSAYIPLGAVHRLENPGKVDLHLIEVQTGAYLGEDDIIRYEDVYARK